ncbi:MAG TPA: M20/M25/M40 family metallo-hydrolase [Bryobacteraceae bacterium]|nr:M20/M25/M40 family metallo-hydrolase [Bryobacteraceae bacterium]
MFHRTYRRVSRLISIAGLLGSAAWAQIPAINWEAQKAEILRHYRDLIQIDTSSPPGNETRAVDYLKKVLEAEGIPTKTFAVDPSRANLVARLKGNGKKRPVLLMAHTDVVSVQREKWPVDPFGAVMKDGYVWGRGSSDDKDKLAANLMVMLLLKRSGATLDRDVIFLAEAGEEGDSQFGAMFMADQHFDEIDAEFALTEAGNTVIRNGEVAIVEIETAEKVPHPVRLVANGISGHASRPRVDNAVAHVATAVAKLAAWQTPMRLNDTTRSYFEKLATVSTPEQAARYNGLTRADRTAEVQRYVAENEPIHYSMLRTSVVPTIIKGGFRTNVIPSEAEATIDIRALPDEDMTRFFAEMTRVIGDPAVKFGETNFGIRPPTPPSRLDSEMYLALERSAKRVYPRATVIPMMQTGATDMAYLRAKGVQSYGIGPAATEQDTNNFGAHSDVERLPESSLYPFVEFTWNAVTDVVIGK